MASSVVDYIDYIYIPHNLDVDGAVILAQRAAKLFGSEELLVSQKITLKPESRGFCKGEKSLPLAGEPSNFTKVKWV